MDIYKRVEELALDKFCCAQIVMKVGLELVNKENPDMIKAMRGLCMGTHVQEQCGTFSAAACMLSLFAEEQTPELIQKMAAWFENRYNTKKCFEILAANNNDILKCRDLTAEACQYCYELLEEYDLLPDED